MKNIKNKDSKIGYWRTNFNVEYFVTKNMTEILIGMDISGDAKSDNYKYIAIVFGTKDCIDSQMRTIGLSRLHMRSIRSKDLQKKVFHKLDFSGENIKAFCLKIEKNEIINKLLKSKKRQNKNYSQAKILKYFNNLIWNCIKHDMRDFFTRHAQTLNNAHIQSDQDLLFHKRY